MLHHNANNIIFVLFITLLIRELLILKFITLYRTIKSNVYINVKNKKVYNRGKIMIKKKLALLLITAMTVSILSTGFSNSIVAHAETIATVETEEKNENYIWLSELTWDSKSFTRYGSLKKQRKSSSVFFCNQTCPVRQGHGAGCSSHRSRTRRPWCLRSSR